MNRNLIAISTLIFVFLFANYSFAQNGQYRCPPCSFDCHDVYYEKSGLCPICQMELIKIVHSQYEGYLKEEKLIINRKDSTMLNSVLYLPEKSKMEGLLIIGHGSAPTTYEDVSYYINIGTKLKMGVLAFDKRGVGKCTQKRTLL